jgi:hypothetical protein
MLNEKEIPEPVLTAIIILSSMIEQIEITAEEM